MKSIPLMLLATCALPFFARAESVPVLDKASFSLALAIPDNNTKVSFDSNVDDTPIQFDKDLGLTTSNIVTSISATWRPWNNHQFSFTYYNDSNANTLTLDESIEWEGVIYDGTIKAKSNVTTYDISYVWWGLNRERWALGPRLGVLYYDFGVQLDLIADADGNPVLDGSFKRSINPSFPVPALGVAWRGLVADHWRASLDAGYFSANSGDFDGSISYIGAGLEWFPHENWGLSFNLLQQNIEVRATKVDYSGDLNFTGTNASLGLTYRF